MNRICDEQSLVRKWSRRMFNLTLSVLVIASIALFFSYWLLQKKHQQEQSRLHKEYITRINKIKASYKSTLELYSLQRVIRPASVRQFYAIIDNYFVHQPVNEQSICQLENMANAITITVAREFNQTRNSEDTEWLKKKLLHFAIKLPDQDNEYNRAFYQNKLKGLLRGLNASRVAFVQQHAA
jgi:hypothetical protein